MSSLLVEAISVSATYGRPVLMDFDLAVGPGEVTVLVGLNGAGKSTALRVLSGQMPAARGRVRIAGGDPRRAKTRRDLYFLAESGDPPAHLTAAECVRFYMDLYDCSGPREAVVARCLERVGLTEVRRRRPATFSKGMRRRLELASLLAVDRKVWLLDEPQSGLDPSGTRLARELILEAKARERAVVLATHALSDVEPLADQILVLQKGRIRFRGDRADLRREVGVRSFDVIGNEVDDGAIVRCMEELGTECKGPRVSLDALESYLFGDRA